MTIVVSERRSAQNRRPLGGTLVTGILIICAILLFSLVGHFLIDPTLAQVGAVSPRRPPGAGLLLGSDAQGRDILALLILGTPATLKMGLVAGFIGVGLALVLGLVSGSFGGPADTVIRILADAFMTVPAIAVLVIIAGNVDHMTSDIMALLVAALAWMHGTRTIRAQVLTIRHRSYIEVARVNGEGEFEILFREILPNLLPFVVASFVGTVGAAILAIIGLEALGLGPPDEVTLGNTIFWSQQSSAVLRGYWWWWAPPIAIIALIFVGLFLLSVGFDRFANPRLRAQ